MFQTLFKIMSEKSSVQMYVLIRIDKIICVKI